MDELRGQMCPLCQRHYWSNECPHDFEQMENDVIALRAENERQAKAKSQIIKQLNDAWVERDALRAQLDIAVKALDNYKYFHPRAKKLIEKRKPFLVVANDEPYYRQVYDLIRDNEMLRGRWTIEDEHHYNDALAEIAKLGGGKS